MDNLIKYFDGFVKLSSESKELICASLQFEVYKKGEFLWKAGQRCNSIYFVQSGIIRLFFYTETGEEKTVHFITPDKFVADLESLESHAPSSVSCVSIVDSEIIVVSGNALQKFNKEVYEWHELMRRIIEKTLFEKIKIRDTIFQKEAKERYQSFLEHFSSVASYAQANHIASYLDISQFTLSHLKKELSKDNFLRNSKN